MAEIQWVNKLESWEHLKFWNKVWPEIDNELTLYERAGEQDKVFPSRDRWFRALELTPFEKVRVVILGQDPYPTRGHADGLAFSVQPHVRPLPRSLRNVLREYREDLGYPAPSTGDLTGWAQQGVLLLNTILTVEEGKPLSHEGLGWEKLTLEILTSLNEKKERLAILLWGKKAQEYAARFDQKKHLVLGAAHPSPYSANNGFFGCRHFSKAAEYLSTSKDMWKLR